MADIDMKAIFRNAEQSIVHPFEGMYNSILGGDKHTASSVTIAKADVVHEAKETKMAGGSGLPTDVKSPIADMNVPDGWSSSRTERGGIGTRALNEFAAPDGSGVTLSLFQEGLALKAGAAAALAGVLGKGPHQLLPSEIVAVRDAIGYSNAGDNQYTDKNYQPAFNLSTAGVARVNDKDVLVVEGKYNNGGKSFKGIYAPFVDDSGATRVQQVFIEGAPSAVAKHLGTFKSAIDSIKWNDSYGTTGSSTDHKSPPPHNTGMIR
jgi:hypothetical protein